MVGHDSRARSQTVTSQLNDSSRNGSRVLLCCIAMSIPISRMTSMASGRTRVAFVPALKTSKRSPAQARSMPSAIWLRALLWVQTKITRGREDSRVIAHIVRRLLQVLDVPGCVHAGESVWITIDLDRIVVEKGYGRRGVGDPMLRVSRRGSQRHQRLHQRSDGGSFGTL